MRVKKVNRYYCDFCKKSGCAAGHMRSHERHCTLNPNRVCRMCGRLDQEQPKLSDVIALLPNPNSEEYCNRETEWDGEKGFAEAVEKAMPGVREATGNCPMCIMAALRQRGIPVPVAESFHYAEELKAIWDIINAERYDSYR
jgi:hypothetical protein